MMEQTDSKRNEYIWAMKISFVKKHDDENWRNRKITAPIGTTSGFASELGKKYTYFNEGSLKIMSSLVPDEVIYNIDDFSRREFNACLLIGDVSGFTELCEKYNKAGRGGPSKLTQVLNAYIGAMVQEILSHSGDVLKFSGDAFIAVWKETEHLSIRDAVHEAIDCSLVIQKSYGTYQTDIDVIVRVKLAVACGHLSFSLIGTNEDTHYLLIGPPVLEIKEAENLSKAGDIIITSRVSHHIGANEYLIDQLSDGVHAKVLGVGPNWRNIQRRYENISEKYGIVSEFRGKSSGDSQSGSSTDLDSKEHQQVIVQDHYALRPAVNYACRMRMKDQLKGFILAPVLRGIEAEEPVEYLTEIRQVVILFINCKVKGGLSADVGLSVSNEVYKAVCNIVKENRGCVNKINYFDKDLMLLVIFGLRGFKHELECRIALKCAKECYQQLQKIKYIYAVSVGVTTGKTYCGVFGHSLRREYTVIGLIVNKAARMMVAYQDRVTCDRETFLHSKLEPRNFVLQEFKPLKGIVSPGPIYQFKEVDKVQDEATHHNIAPLLGRDQEVDLYKTLLDQAKGHSVPNLSNMKVCNMLIIKGVHRQGKTRMLEELIILTESTIPVFSFSLTHAEYEVPYHTIREIFKRFFGTNSTLQDIVDCIQKTFESTNFVPYLCLFNAIFNINFPKTPEYTNLSEEQKYEGLQKLFVAFVKKICTKLCVIAIDDSEYVDDESWLLIKLLLDLNVVFFVVTMGSQKILSVLAVEVLRGERIKVIELKNFDKWYHVGLACQMLQVEGIPPELEKTIQMKCNGNPGWVDSFLVSLLQSGGIFITEMSRKEAIDLGIVIAPLYMIIRMSEEEVSLFLEIMGEEIMSKKGKVFDTRWKMFIEGCRESYPDLVVSQHFGNKLHGSSKVPIAILNPEFNLEDVDPELVIDVIILKTFDDLNSYEQLLLKSSAILGDTFPRTMLLYIMSTSAIRLTAIAVKKLFEINVLCCARGNFIEGGLNFKDRLINPNEDMTIKCECKGLIIDDTCLDLPKYASCGYMRFRSSVFRETTYNLLTENQKTEFHEKAIRYLEKETRRCRTCGNGYFTRQMGVGRLDRHLRMARPIKKQENKSSIISEINLTEGTKYDRTSLASYESISTTKSTIKRETSFHTDTISIVESNTLVDEMHLNGFNTIRKWKDNFTLVRTFSNTDYSQCTCSLILSTMYAQVIEHCKGAGFAEKILHASVEYAYVCIDSNNIPQAIRILEEALVLIEGPMRDQIELDWMITLKRAKFFALIGRARMEISEEESYSYLINALKCYGINFPKSGFGRRIIKFHYKFKHLFRFYLWPNRFRKVVDDDVAEYCNDVAECLSFLYIYYDMKHKYQEAELAAMWSLSYLLKTETDFEKICWAYGNLICIASLQGKHTFCVALEVYALKICHRKKTLVEYDELKAIAYLYYSISKARLRRAETEKFLHVGYVAWRLASSSKCPSIIIKLLPKIAYVTLTKRQILEYGNLLQDLSYVAEQENSISGRTWYYALAMMMHIETSLSVEAFSQCEKYMMSEGKDPKHKNHESIHRMWILIWLWEVRNANWEAAVAWQHFAWSFTLDKKGDRFQNMITALYLVEGLIIYMVSKMDMKNLSAVQNANKLINVLLKLLQKQINKFKFLKPRLYHLKGYYLIVRNDYYKTGFKWINKAVKWAERYQNDLELKWMKQNEMAWVHKLSKEDLEFWKEHADEDNLIDFRDIEYMEKFVHYCLPLPIYV